MAEIFFLLKFFGGILLVFATGGVVGHLLKLDKYIEDQQNYGNERIREANKKDIVPTRKLSPQPNPPAGGWGLASPIFDSMLPMKKN
jgi:hypothetical protein